MKFKLIKTLYFLKKRFVFTVMKVFIFLLCTSVFSMNTDNLFSQEKVTIDKTQLATVDQVFKIIKKQTDYRFIYPKNLFKNASKVTLNAGEIEVTKLLEKCLSSNNLQFELTTNNTIIIKDKVFSKLIEKQAQQQQTITGVVKDNTGVPLLGVSIMIKGTSTGTSTDFDGEFSLKAESANILQMSFLGYKTVEIKVGNQTIINVTLEESAQALEDLVITAQGIKKSKKALGYAITSLNSEDVEQRPEADLARTLQGKISGVSISATNGETGATSSISIRGSVSINQSNAPLIVLNNVPFSGVLSDIDPNDIESMNILKGLNAAALYGSEGRNGVILIQTKSGNATLGESKTTTSFSTIGYLNMVSQLPEYQNTIGQGQEGSYVLPNLSHGGPEFSSLKEVPHPYSDLSSIFPEFQNVMVPYEAKRNNVKNLFDTGIGKIHSLAIATSKDKVAFNISAGYTDELGIIGDNNLKRFNIGLGGAAQVSEKINISATLNYSTRKVNRIQARDVFDRVFYLARSIDLTELPYQNPVTGESVNYRNTETNPLWLLKNAGSTDDITRVFGTFNANYVLNDNLNFTYRVGYDSEHRDDLNYSNRGGKDGNYITGYLDLSNRKEVTVDQTFLLGYNKELNDDFNLEVQLGANSKLTKIKRQSSNSDQQIVYNFINPNNYTASESFYYQEDRNIAGVFGQVQLAYKNYLYATMSGRNDFGASVEKENQSLFYPGASASFIPTSAFDMSGDVINYLKVRAAYATSSGYPEQYRTRNALIIDANRFVAADGTKPVTNRFSSIFGNPNLRPEIHQEFEVGLETKLFKNRVNLEVSYYSRISTDQIVASTLAPSTGFDRQFINLGRIDNKGLEIDLGFDIIKNNQFKWNFRNIFTAERSLVVETTPTGGNIELGADRFAVEGQPLNAIIGIYALRDNEGNLLIDGTGSSTTYGKLLNSGDVGLDPKVIGNPNPDWRLTTINSFSYKNFTLSAQIEYTHGGEISSLAVEDMLERGVTRDTENRAGSFVIPGFLANHETGEPLLDNNGNKIPNTIQLNGIRTLFGNYYNAKDLSMWDTSVFRLREIAFGYSFKKKEGQNLPFEKLDLTFIGRNLWYRAPNFPKYINYDPESDGGLGRTNVPSTKRFSLGLSVTF
jgi:TonB-linked SusC/RagA family outer membrane protein